MQRLSEIARLPSGCLVEERVHIFKKAPRAGGGQRKAPTGSNIPVRGNDLEHACLTLRIRLRPQRQYPAARFYELEHADASQGKAGQLQMALVLEASFAKELTSPHTACISGSDLPGLGMALRATLFAPRTTAISSSEGSSSTPGSEYTHTHTHTHMAPCLLTWWRSWRRWR